MALTVKDGVCNVVEKPVECHVLVGQTVTLGVVTNDRPAQPYMAVQTLIEIDQLVYKPAPLASDEIIWPDCALPLRFATGSRVAHACGSSLAQPFPPSTYSGNLVNIQVTCPQTPVANHLELIPYGPIPLTNGSTYRLLATNNMPGKILPMSDTLTINCVESVPTPASVGGVSFPPPSDGADRAFDTTAATALGAVAVALAATAWYARRRLR